MEPKEINPTAHNAYDLEREVDALERRVIRDSLLIARRDQEMMAVFLPVSRRILITNKKKA